MSDIFSAAKRSAVMRSIRSTRNLSTENKLASALRKAHVAGWRRHHRIVPRAAALKANTARPVRPDFVFPAAKLAVFLDGCFWHCCPLHSTVPKGNRVWWKKKLAANTERDARNTFQLRRCGWRVLRIWEHDLRRNPSRCVALVQRALGSTRHSPGRGHA